MGERKRRRPIFESGTMSGVCPLSHEISRSYRTRWGEARARRDVDAWFIEHAECEDIP